jgi:L-lysine 6-transaminase
MAVDLVDPSQRAGILKAVFDQGMLILPTGARGIRFRPSLITTEQEIDRAIDILARAARGASTGKTVAAV